MNDFQEIQINVGLNYTDDSGKVSEIDGELGRLIVENKFSHCGIISEPYVSSWECKKTGITYDDKCLAFRIVATRLHSFGPDAIKRRVQSIGEALRQDAVAYAVRTGDATYGALHYIGETDQKDEFDARYFHHVS